MNASTGIDMTEFFNDWLYNQGWPNYNITWSKDIACQKIYVTIGQTHSANLGTFFEMPVPISFTGIVNGNTVTDTVVFDQNSPTQMKFEYNLGFNPTSAAFDPENGYVPRPPLPKFRLIINATSFGKEQSAMIGIMLQTGIVVFRLLMTMSLYLIMEILVLSNPILSLIAGS